VLFSPFVILGRTSKAIRNTEMIVVITDFNEGFLNISLPDINLGIDQRIYYHILEICLQPFF
jgi:hypothetical protein